MADRKLGVVFEADTTPFETACSRVAKASQNSGEAIKTGIGRGLEDLKSKFGRRSVLGEGIETLMGGGAIAGVTLAIHEISSAFREAEEKAAKFLTTVVALQDELSRMGKSGAALTTMNANAKFEKRMEELKAQHDAVSPTDIMFHGGAHSIALNAEAQHLAGEIHNKELEQAKKQAADELQKSGEAMVEADQEYLRQNEQIRRNHLSDVNNRNEWEKEAAMALVEGDQEYLRENQRIRSNWLTDQANENDRLQKVGEEMVEADQRYLRNNQEIRDKHLEAVGHEVAGLKLSDFEASSATIAQRLAMESRNPALAPALQLGSVAAVSAENRASVRTSNSPTEFAQQAVDLAKQQLTETRGMNRAIQKAVAAAVADSPDLLGMLNP